MRKTKLFIILCLLVIFSSPINATVTVTYAPVSALVFETGTFPFASTDFVAHIGTFTFESTDNKLFDPALVNMSVSNNFEFSGLVTWYNHWETGLPVYEQDITTFSLASVSTVKGTTRYVKLWGEDDGIARLTNEGGNFNTAVFIAKLYFLGDQSSSKYKPGEYYTLTSGILDTFKVAVASGGGGIYNSMTYIPVGTQTGPISFVPGPLTSLPYGDPNPPFDSVDYELTIIENQAFTLQNAFTTNASQIAQAQLIVTNATPNTAYGINVEFRDASNSAIFALYLDGNTLLYSIPYKLRFLNQEVVGNVPILWNNLSNGTFLQDISVTGIDPTTAGRAPSGSYSEVITVTITPIDSI
ncbi:MAG: hypothetical protein JEY71_09475 [Sphaerochaeta sp.]|nr:hypothetical protein [Sphaerochaeta sp.]